MGGKGKESFSPCVQYQEHLQCRQEQEEHTLQTSAEEVSFLVKL